MDAQKGKKAQVAIDFLISYGVAMLIIAVSIVAVVKLGILNPILSPVSCTPSPGFSCGFFYITQNGILTINMSQAIGGAITINGISCSSNYNQSGDFPEYGNVYVTGNSVYYPAGSAPGSGIDMYSGTSDTFEVYCYDPNGKAVGSINNIFYGHLWLNYTIEGSGYNTVTQSVATFTASYV